MVTNKLLRASIIYILVLLFNGAEAQTFTKYWVKFINKTGSPYSVSNPSAFLSAKSLSRRVSQGIAVDITDIPVNQNYINQVNATGAVVLQRSKWFNAAIVLVANTTQLNAINSLSCVVNTNPVARLYKTADDELVLQPASSFKSNTTSSTYLYGQSITQISQIGADCMHNAGFRGQGMTIAVVDAGFNQVNTNPVFDSLRNDGRLLGTRDIVAGNTSVYEDDSHGALVLSCISGNAPNNLIGTGPKASVYLLRTEDVSSEKIIEENNWVIAAELADSLGIDIITTSLGYTTFDISSQNHTYAHLNGKTSVASIAATMAARKGMFVLNAAGNEGASLWNYIGIPADADSICTVGSVNGGGIHSSFSSVGPTADGRIKPDLSTMGEGTYVCGPGYNFYGGNGTSFACPIMAGAVACLWQANPTKTNMELLQALKLTASKNATPDNNYGWGIPNVCAAHNYLNNTTLSVKNNERIESISIYPNPTQQYIKFKLSHLVKDIIITDILGNVVNYETISNVNNTYQLELDKTISSGVYFISINTNDGLFNSKFLKN